MTVFMHQVDALLHGSVPAGPGPAVRPSRRRSVGHGAHEMVEVRSLAEQLVSEANAVLAGTGPKVTLDDEAGQHRLAFRLGCGRAWARVVTSFAQRRSWGQLVTPDSSGTAYELAGSDALPDLIAALISAGRHDATSVRLRCPAEGFSSRS